MPLVVPEKKALLLNLKNPDKVTAVLPKYQFIEAEGIKWLAVPHTTDTYHVLRNLEVKVSGYEPMRTHYQYPKLFGMHAPMAHQQETAVFCTVNKRCYVLNEMRTGKTASVLWAADFLHRSKQVKGTLILSTMSCMTAPWKSTLFSLFPHRTVAVLHGDRATRKKLLAMDFDFYIINHDGIKVISKELIEAVKAGRINLMIVDEGAEFRNAKTENWKVLKELGKNCPRLWWMTGTPVPNGPEDAWAQCRIVTPHTVPEFFGSWRTLTMLKVSDYKWIARDGSKERVFQAMQPAIRYKKSDVIDVMPVTYDNREAELTTEQLAAYNEIRRQGAIKSEDGTISAANAAIVLQKLNQIAAGVVKNDKGELIYYRPTKRLAVLDELVKGAEAKVIVFAWNVAVLDMLVEHLKTYVTVAKIDGSVVGRARDKIVHDFQNGTAIDVVVAQPRTTGHGLELSAADVVIWYGPTDSTNIYEQACHRVLSGMQKNSVGIYHIGSTAHEWRIFRKLKDGVDIQQDTLALYDAEIKGLPA